MREDGERQGWLGVYLEDLSPQTRSALGLSEDKGVVVGGTVEGSAADKGGLKKGDVILTLDGAPVSGESDVREQLKDKAGQQIHVEVLRAGKPLTLTFAAGDRSEDDGWKLQRDMPEPPDVPDVPEVEGVPEGPGRHMTVIVGAGAWLGVEPQDLGRELGEAFGVSDGKGVLVSKVLPGSPADKAGLKAGDVIVRFDGKKMEGEADLRRALRDLHKGRTVEVEAIRKKEPRKFTVKLNSRPDMRIGPMSMPDLGQWTWNFREEDRARLQEEMHRLRADLDRLRDELRDLRVNIRDEKDDH
jgi:serine protease Do